MKKVELNDIFNSVIFYHFHFSIIQNKLLNMMNQYEIVTMHISQVTEYKIRQLNKKIENLANLLYQYDNNYS
jgi:hypothetical protein